MSKCLPSLRCAVCASRGALVFCAWKEVHFCRSSHNLQWVPRLRRVFLLHDLPQNTLDLSMLTYFALALCFAPLAQWIERQTSILGYL